eukprot:4579903-Prymnesium_polylepis.1
MVRRRSVRCPRRGDSPGQSAKESAAHAAAARPRVWASRPRLETRLAVPRAGAWRGGRSERC